MKKLLVATMVMAIGLVGTIAYGWQGYGPGPGSQVDVNALRQFQKETLPLRDELAAKRLELRNEYAKQNPDQNKITRLQNETADLRTKIQASADKHGVPAYGRGGRGDAAWGNGPRGGAGWGCGAPRMMGAGYCYGGGPGYGRGYCPAW